MVSVQEGDRRSVVRNISAVAFFIEWAHPPIRETQIRGCTVLLWMSVNTVAKVLARSKEGQKHEDKT